MSLNPSFGGKMRKRQISRDGEGILVINEKMLFFRLLLHLII